MDLPMTCRGLPVLCICHLTTQAENPTANSVGHFGRHKRRKTCVASINQRSASSWELSQSALS